MLNGHGNVEPVLAEAYTEPFEVMSAKRFPGMLDPTPLSRAFAKQGLRIPTVSDSRWSPVSGKLRFAGVAAQEC